MIEHNTRTTKIVGIGLPKTGTTTLNKCFSRLGFKHHSYNPDVMQLILNDRLDEVFKLVNEYETFENIPWCLLHPEFDRKYPDAKFILTVRESGEKWMNSLTAQQLKNGSAASEANRKMFLSFIKKRRIYCADPAEYYRHHNESVRKYFEKTPWKLLEVCWEKGDGWQQVCDFIGVPVPDIPFPFENKSPLFLPPA